MAEGWTSFFRLIISFITLAWFSPLATAISIITNGSTDASSTSDFSNVTSTSDFNNSLYVTTTEDTPAYVNRQSRVYGYGTLAVLIVSLPPFAAVSIVRLSKYRIYKYVINAMLGLGVGSLIGDSLLHLLPEVFGGSAGEEGGDKKPLFFWKLVSTCAAVWLYFIIQLSIQSLLLYKKSKNKQSIGVGDNASRQIAGESGDGAGDEYNSAQMATTVATTEDKINSTEQLVSKEAQTSKGLEAVGWMVTIGDMMHNFTDGLAVGAAFSDSVSVGVSTTIAIFVHEVPQEFGDAALMLASGWSWKKVLLFNCLSQLSAFVGLYIGIGVSQVNKDAESWILAVTAGTFFYLALADAVPEILEICATQGNFMIYICPNIGVLVGFVIMILLALYEDQIHI